MVYTTLRPSTTDMHIELERGFLDLWMFWVTSFTNCTHVIHHHFSPPVGRQVFFGNFCQAFAQQIQGLPKTRFHRQRYRRKQPPKWRVPPKRRRRHCENGDFFETARIILNQRCFGYLDVFMFNSSWCIHLSSETKTGCSGYIGDYITHLCWDYFRNHYNKDPYWTTSISWKVCEVFFFFFVAHLDVSWKKKSGWIQHRPWKGAPRWGTKQGPPRTWDPLGPILFPYHSHKSP